MAKARSYVYNLPRWPSSQDILLTVIQNKIALRPQDNHLRTVYGDTPEFAAFALWEGALSKKAEIQAALEREFQICAQIDIHWSDRYYHQNIRRLYQRPNNLKQLESDSGYKLSDKIGKPPFRLIIVRDRDPQYTFKQSVSGIIEPTNVKVHKLKGDFRRLFSKPYQVHSTNNMSEFLFQVSLLLGPEALNKLLRGEHLSVRELHRDLTGAGGWDHVSDLLEVLNFSVEYVVLRNYASLPASVADPDIDLLCNDYQKAASAINLSQKEGRPYKGTTVVGGKALSVDLRFVGDQYYDPLWASEILSNREFTGAFYHPSMSDYFFSLLYHAKVHKPQVKQEYRTELSEIARLLDFDWFTETTLSSDQEAARALSGYMRARGYSYQRAVDPGVHVHRPVVAGLPVSPIAQIQKGGVKTRMKKLRKSLKASIRKYIARR